MGSRIHKAYFLLLAVVCLAVGACASPQTRVADYRNIAPRWDISNSPIPIPSPKAKPSTRRFAGTSSSPRLQWSPASSKAPSRYRVRAGDTVYGLARQYGLNAQTIIQANALSRPYHLRQGQVLALAPQKASKARVVRATAQTAQPRKPNQRTYTVRSGQGLYAIARANGVPAQQIIKANNLRKPYKLRKGQVLKIPNAGRTVMAGKTPRISPDAGSATFIWPVKGDVVSGYGVTPDGLRNDGINIAAREGRPVFASAGGEVIYAGDRLRAFGNLILVRHSSGMVSTYAHLGSLMVQEGDRVQQGEQIATVGQTGLVSAPQLHFELRRNSAAIDPMRYLGRLQMASAKR